MILLLSLFMLVLVVKAQHEHHAVTDTMPSHHADSSMEDMESSVLMTHAYSLNLPMNRNGSGTSWLPNYSPMYMYILGDSKQSVSIHGSLFVRYNDQDVFESGTRGAMKWDVVSMLMGMYNRRIGDKGLFNATVMISADPIIMGGSGYPLQFQTGETYNGAKLVDRQHPARRGN